MSALKILVCGVLFIQILLSLLEGSSFHKYVKLFGYLLIMYMCCSFMLTVISKLPETVDSVLKQYEQTENNLLWGQE